MNLLMISCKKSTELMEKRISFSLSLSEKIQLNIHKQLCTYCRRYEKQSIFIEKLLQSQSRNTESVPAISDEKASEVIAKILDKNNL